MFAAEAKGVTPKQIGQRQSQGYSPTHKIHIIINLYSVQSLYTILLADGKIESGRTATVSFGHQSAGRGVTTIPRSVSGPVKAVV